MKRKKPRIRKTKKRRNRGRRERFSGKNFVQRMIAQLHDAYFVPHYVLIIDEHLDH